MKEVEHGADLPSLCPRKPNIKWQIKNSRERLRKETMEARRKPLPLLFELRTLCFYFALDSANHVTSPG